MTPRRAKPKPSRPAKAAAAGKKALLSRRKKEQDAARRKQEQDAARRKKEQDAARRKKEQDAARRKKEQDAARRKKEQDAARRKKEQDAARRKKEQDAARRKKEQDAARRKKEQDAARRKKEQDAARRKKEQDAARRKKEQELAARRAAKAREQERVRLEKERARAARERARAREAEQARRLAERAAADRAREEARARQKAERDAARDEARRLKEEERLRLQAERDAARDEARRLKEEERARREAEREAYRKAKEVERERLRAEREAARRALEGRVARATRRAQRVAGVGRSSTTRVYRPDAIPNQSGTTRRLGDGEPQQQNRFANLRAPEPSSPANAAPDALADADHRPPLSPAPAASPPPPPEPSIPDRFDERYALIEARLANADESFRKAYDDNFDMSWIHHDSALEGVVYTFLELKTAIDPAVSVVADSSLQPVCAEIRRHKAAIQLVRELGEKKRVPLGVDVIKKIFLVLHPEEGDLKSVKYRKDIPQHRLYFHEYAAPDKIAYKVRQVVDWLNGPEPKKVKNPVRIAARVHYDLLRVFPFAVDSGKVARLLMNVLLLRAGYPPAIIHSTERQRYYEALKGSLPTIVSMMNEAIGNGLASVEKLLDEHGIRAPSEPPPIG